MQNEESSNEIVVLNSNQEKEEPPQDFDIFQLIREECSTKVSEEKKQSMEDTMLDALNSKLVLINSNSQHLDKKEQEVKNVVEQPAKRENRNIQSLQNFRVVHKIYDDDFEDVEYVEASLPDPEIVCVEEENTRSGNTTHANDSLPEYDLFCFEIEPHHERLINIVKNDTSDDSSNDPLLEEADLFLASDNSIPPGIENFTYNSEGDIRFLKALLIDDPIPFPNNESSESDFDNPSIPLPPPEPPDAEFDFEPDSGEEISDERFDPGGEINIFANDEDYDYFPSMFVIRIFLPYLTYPEVSPLLFSAESEDTIFDPGISI
nr:hypothetical protein [Tanacetum cinerariifolium]